MTDLHELPDDVAALLRPMLPPSDEQMAAMTAPDVLKASALWYAAHDWPVFPIVPGGKTPLTRNGFKDATTDTTTISAWWNREPDANIATPTGLLFDVIDIDAPYGFDSWRRFVEHLVADTDYRVPPLLASAYTGGGGRHLYIAATGAGNKVAVARGLDYRGAGGYVCLPPSRLDGGNIYAWLQLPQMGTT